MNIPNRHEDRNLNAACFKEFGLINLLYGNWIAAGVAGLFCAGLFSTDRYDLEMVRTALPGYSAVGGDGPQK